MHLKSKVVRVRLQGNGQSGRKVVRERGFQWAEVVEVLCGGGPDTHKPLPGSSWYARIQTRGLVVGHMQYRVEWRGVGDAFSPTGSLGP